jgi:hypothetical protein
MIHWLKVRNGSKYLEVECKNAIVFLNCVCDSRKLYCEERLMLAKILNFEENRGGRSSQNLAIFISFHCFNCMVFH